jgi:hypothetical protein
VDRLYPTGLLLLVVAVVEVVLVVLVVQEEDCRAAVILKVEPKLLVVLEDIYVMGYRRWFGVQEVKRGHSV